MQGGLQVTWKMLSMIFIYICQVLRDGEESLHKWMPTSHRAKPVSSYAAVMNFSHHVICINLCPLCSEALARSGNQFRRMKTYLYHIETLTWEPEFLACVWKYHLANNFLALRSYPRAGSSGEHINSYICLAIILRFLSFF